MLISLFKFTADPSPYGRFAKNFLGREPYMRTLTSYAQSTGLREALSVAGRVTLNAPFTSKTAEIESSTMTALFSSITRDVGVKVTLPLAGEPKAVT